MSYTEKTDPLSPNPRLRVARTAESGGVRMSEIKIYTSTLICMLLVISICKLIAIEFNQPLNFSSGWVSCFITFEFLKWAKKKWGNL